jgi:hypothetical protein
MRAEKMTKADARQAIAKRLLEVSEEQAKRDPGARQLQVNLTSAECDFLAEIALGALGRAGLAISEAK